MNKPVDINKNELLTKENIQNASSLLALLHGKSDSLCRLFNKEIMVDKDQLQSLNNLMIQKLSLNNVESITTSIDIVFNNKNILTFKSWDEFEQYNFLGINSFTKSLFIQWDFFANLSYKFPQRHTVSVRISAAPNPSDMFKVLINGGFDGEHDLDIQSSTMICKVDFVNNTLAEELINVISNWNDLCECAYSKKNRFIPILYKYRRSIANTLEFSIISSICLSISIIIKIIGNKSILSINDEFIVFLILIALPLNSILKDIARYFGKNIFNKISDLIDTHIFKISKGDEKENARIESSSKFKKELLLFLLNIISTAILSIIFFLIE